MAPGRHDQHEMPLAGPRPVCLQAVQGDLQAARDQWTEAAPDKDRPVEPLLSDILETEDRLRCGTGAEPVQRGCQLPATSRGRHRPRATGSLGVRLCPGGLRRRGRTGALELRAW